MSWARRMGRAGLLTAGLVTGFLVTVLVLWLYVGYLRDREVERLASAALGLPEGAFQLEDVDAQGFVRGSLRRVALLDRDGDTVVTSPWVTFRLDARSLAGDGPIVIGAADVRQPFLRMEQDAAGNWNVSKIFRIEADGNEVRPPAAEEGGRAIVLSDVRVTDGRAVILMPSETGPPPDTAVARFAAAGARRPDYVRQGRRWATAHTVRDLDARLRITLPGTAGWKVEVLDASAETGSPDLTVTALRGTFESQGGDEVRFRIAEFRTPRSAMDADGTITLGETAAYDFTLRAHPLDLRDLGGLGFAVPAEGTARFALDVETRDGGRTALAFRDAALDVGGSHAEGRLGVLLAPGRDPSFFDTSIRLDPLRLTTLEELALVDSLPVAGDVRGTVSAEGSGGLDLDVEARVVPRGRLGDEPSVVGAAGRVAFGGGELRMDGLRVTARPLRLETLAGLMPDQAAMLRGVVEGGVTVSGTMREVALSGGALTYVVGDAPPTRLEGLSGRVALEPALRYSLEARADPLALGTLTALFPTLPFRGASLTGPISLAGSADDVTLRADLDGPAGAIALRATSTLGEVPRFDVNAQLTAFRAGGLLTTGVPFEGPMTGTITARGTTRDFRFGANLAQGSGSFALDGTARKPGDDPYQFDVSGQVNNFRIGALLGQPNLLPTPVTGPIRVSGGGRQPYFFDVNLQGGVGILDVEGEYAPGPVPRYRVTGRVAEVNLHGLPGMAAVPDTRLTGTVDIDARGLTAETFGGRLAFDVVPGSTVGGIPVEEGRVRVSAADGLLRVETFVLALRGARAEATGTLGLRDDEQGSGLMFMLDAPDLGRVAGLFPRPAGQPVPVSGALTLTGGVTGSLRHPVIRANGTGRDFRYQGYRFGSLTLDVEASEGPEGWRGEGNVYAENAVLGSQRLATARLQATLEPGRGSFALSAARDAETDVVARGVLELDGTTVRGAILDTLALRLGGQKWLLADRARVAFTAQGGLEVENLALRRELGTGWIRAEGSLPSTGQADLVVSIRGLDVAEVERLYPPLPEMQGVVTLDLAIRGDVTDPVLDVTGSVLRLRYAGVSADSVALEAHYRGGRMEATAGVRMGGREIMTGRGSIPMRLSLGGFVPGVEIVDTEPLTASLVADSVPLELLTAVTPLVTDGAGVARLRVNVSGTPGQPRVAGTGTVTGGSVTLDEYGVRYSGIEAYASFAGNRMDSLLVTAQSDGGGRAELRGSVTLDDPKRPAAYLTATLDNFQVMDKRDLAEIEASGALVLSGRFPDAVVSGRLTLDDSRVYIPEFGGAQPVDVVDVEVGSLGADSVVAPAQSGMAALLATLNAQDLEVALEDNVWLESPDLRVQIAGEVAINRFGGATRITGELQAPRGTYVLRIGPLIREFEIASGRVEFYGTPDFNPAVEILAEHTVRTVDASNQDLTVQVRVSGTLQNPSVALTSDTRPPLPESELLSLLIFGRRSTELGALPGQLAQGLLVQEAIGGLLAAELEQTLARTRIVDVVQVRASTSGTGLSTDVVDLGLGIVGSPTLVLGKLFFDDRLFVTLEVQNFLSDTRTLGVAADYKISGSTSLRVAHEPVRRDPRLLFFSTGPRYQTTLDVRRVWQYGRPPETPMPRPATPDTLLGEPVVPQPTVSAPVPTGPAIPPPDEDDAPAPAQDVAPPDAPPAPRPDRRR
jgi:hypothetical protein